MRLRHVFLALCIFGVLLPYSQFIPWVLEHGLNLSRLVSDLFANRIGGFFGLDVVMSAIGLCIFIRVEALRIGMRGRWIPVVATLIVGVSLGLPLFLYMRQAHLDQAAA